MKINSLASIIVLLFQTCSSLAGNENIILGQIAVNSGEYKRMDSPVSISLETITNETVLSLYELINGEFLPVDIQFSEDGSRRIHWLLSGTTLPGTTRFYELRSGTGKSGSNIMRVERNPDNYMLHSGDKPVIVYNSGITKAPEGADPSYARSGYIHPLYSPGKFVLTEIQPAGHLHHYGIWNPWTKTTFRNQEVDFWNLAKEEGRVRYGGTASVNEGPVYGSIQVIHEHIAWPDSPSETIAMNELQEIKVYKRNDGMFLIDINARLNPAEEITLEEYRYGGFVLRATSEWTNQNTDFITSEGLGRDQADGQRAEWCLLTGETPGGSAGILMMGHPGNYNHPEPLRVWPSDGSGGRGEYMINFSATRNTSWKLEPGINYSLRYRLIVFDGVIDEATATSLWNDYANPPMIKFNQSSSSTAKNSKWDNRTGKVEGINLLVFTRVGDGGFIHKSLPASNKAFEKLAEQNGINLDISEDPAVFTDENLKNYHAIVFANTNTDVFDTPEQKLSFKRYVQAGGGFAGIHIAVGTERNWPWYKKMIGATFDRHPPYQEFSVRVIDADHPSAMHLPEIWEIKDEPYYVKEYNPEVRVILSHDLSTIEDNQDKPEIFGNLYPSVWCSTFDGGRQWYTGYGHDDHIYSDPDFMRHILGGIKWVIADGLPDYSKARSSSIDDL
jgi:type 1 glutamine amidotransferase